jgi:hypothetical protein
VNFLMLSPHWTVIVRRRLRQGPRFLQRAQRTRPGPSRGLPARPNQLGQRAASFCSSSLRIVPAPPG